MNGAAQNIVSNIQYRGDNQMLSCDYGNGLSDTRTYDLQGRLLTQQLEDALNTIIDNRTYTYDKNSNVLNIDTNLEDNAYLYDKLDRLTTDTIDSNTPIDYTYDLNDNRQSKVLQDASIDELFAYFGNSNRIQATDAIEVGTANTLADIPNRNLIYNDVGRLYQLIEEGTLKAEYIYNDAGQRTRKTNYQADGITIDNITVYHYDAMGYLITETDETGSLIKDYIWNEGMVPVAQIDNNAGTEDIVYLYTDHLMTNRLATDQSQSVVWRWEGEAFGNTPAQELAGTTINLRFPGQYFDAETNLHYNHFRYYEPTLGRYITSDPVGLLGGKNTYLYSRANSLVNTDSKGLSPDDFDVDCVPPYLECLKNAREWYQECYRLFIRPSGPGQVLCRMECGLIGGAVKKAVSAIFNVITGASGPRPNPDVKLSGCAEVCEESGADPAKNYCRTNYKTLLRRCDNNYMVCMGNPPLYPDE